MRALFAALALLLAPPTAAPAHSRPPSTEVGDQGEPLFLHMVVVE